jgi:3-deoxy-D-manno-octulosonic-acid transferase
VLKEKEALVTIDNDDQLLDALGELFRDEKYRTTLGEKAYAAIVEHKGATEKTINTLEGLL